MSQSSEERRELILKACKYVMDEVEEVVTEMRGLAQPLPADGYDEIHLRLLALGTIESELSYLYVKTLKIQHEVELTKLQVKDNLYDARMEAVQKPTFKGLSGEYRTGEETKAKLRSLTYEYEYDYSIWERLSLEVKYLIDTIRTYQQDANKHRRDADLRVKILSMKF